MSLWITGNRSCLDTSTVMPLLCSIWMVFICSPVLKPLRSRMNRCNAFTHQRHIHSMALSTASMQLSRRSSDKDISDATRHQESDGVVHDMDKDGLHGVHSRKEHSPLGGQDELGGTPASQPDCEREAEAAYSSGDDIHAVPARYEGLPDGHHWRRLCAHLLLCTKQLM